MKTILALALVAMSAPQAAFADQPIDRSKPVPPAASRSAQVPALQEATLANGVKLALVEIKRLPIVSVSLLLPRAGAAHEPASKAGLTSLVAGLVQEGAGGLNSRAFAEALDDIGVAMGVSASDDAMQVTFFATKEALDEALKLAASVVQTPDMPQDQFDRLKQQMQVGLRQKRGDPSAAASDRLESRIYGAHPYGVTPTEATLGALQLQDAKDFVAGRFGPQGLVVSAAGDVDLAQFESLVNKHFGSWRAAANANVAAVPVVPGRAVSSGLSIDVIDMPGSQQSAIRAGQTQIARNSPDYYAVSLMNFLLGRAPITNRIEKNLREVHGWAYSARLSPEVKLQGGAYVINADVQTDVTAKALQEVIGELKRIQDEKVSDAELAAAKRLMIGMRANAMQSVEALREGVVDIELNNLPADTLATYRDKINAVTADDIQAAARAHIDTTNLQVVVAGDAAKIVPELQALGQVGVYDVKGQPIPPGPGSTTGR